MQQYPTCILDRDLNFHRDLVVEKAYEIFENKEYHKINVESNQLFDATEIEKKTKMT